MDPIGEVTKTRTKPRTREIVLDKGAEEEERREEERREEEEREREREREREEDGGGVQGTSTHGGARSKTKNYNQMLLEENRESIKNYFPEMNNSVDTRSTPGGKIQIGIFGSHEWTDFKKQDGKINSFHGELKKALGPPLKKLESNYFIELKRIFPHMDENNF